jgi:ubiquinone/menaquinone biosynthesis C-methylase UbiE
MPHREVVEAFDQISPVYDATREPLDPPTLDALAGLLRARKVRTLLEVGVGTGRISAPLAERHFEMIGVDASRRMISLARSKGLSGLVLGNAYRLPFGDGAADTALFVHVLHLLDRPRSALAEAQRVSRFGATALVHPPGSRRSTGEDGGEKDPRRVFFRHLAREGFALPERTGGPGAKERQLLSELPPDELVVLQDREVTEPRVKRIEMFERRASRQTLNVPPDAIARAAAAARAEIGDATVTYRRVEAAAIWIRPVAEAAPTTPQTGGA